MHIERLTILRDFLIQLHDDPKAAHARLVQPSSDLKIPSRFSMSVWHCRTSACAAGYGAFLPELQAQGFGLIDQGFGIEVSFETFAADDATEAFFDLTETEEDYLFHIYTDNCPKSAADRITHLLGGGIPYEE